MMNSLCQSEHVLRRGRRFGRISRPKLSRCGFLLAVVFFISFALSALKMIFSGSIETQRIIPRRFDKEIPGSVLDDRSEPRRSNFTRGKHRKQHLPCEVKLAESVERILEPREYLNFTEFSLDYVSKEDTSVGTGLESRFGGYQTLLQREKSYHARNQTLHCGFVVGPTESANVWFEMNEADKKYMRNCIVAVSSCIFGSSDFLRRPARKKISEFSKENVCFVMFVDKQTLSRLSVEGHIPDENGHVGLWKIIVVRNLPYTDMRKTGKVPKFLSHRLFPSTRYSIWIDSKMRLTTDPMSIIEHFLWHTRSEYAISNHYDRHCVWEEVLQNKRLNKYNHSVIDKQFVFYQSDGLTRFDPSNPDLPLPSYVPEGSFIIRAHTPMSNLFSCLWFNEVDRFTSRDQLSFAYVFLKLRRLNPDKPFQVNMFKDCERRALAKLFQHRALYPPPPPPPSQSMKQ